MNLADFFAEIGQLPRLDGARCRRRHELFDVAGDPDADTDDREYAQTAALALCRVCPALAGCQQWFDALPQSRRPAGVTAGSVYMPRKPRQRRRAS